MQALFLFFSKKYFFLNYIYNLLKRPAESLMCIPDKTETLSFIGISTYSDSQRADDPVEPSAF